jgi:AraC-like DNA-binding protein
MSLPANDLAAAGFAILGRELHAESVTRLVRPHPVHMARLVRLHGSARHLAEAVPEILMRPEASRALEHELVQAMVTCLADDDQARPAPGWRRHGAIIKRFEDVLAAHDNRPMYVAEICAAVGASQSTLRACCCEHLGMGPVRYLWLRRMNLVRRALQRANSITSVTDIATEHGFWELGRFSVQYRALFGESPSVTLHRSPDDCRSANDSPASAGVFA